MHIPAETCNRLKYDIREILLRPGRWPKWYQGRDKAATEQRAKGKQKEKENDKQEWILYKTQQGKALRQLYPLSEKQTNQIEPAWLTRMGGWGRGRKSDS